jgi:hypothetical protein
MRASLAKKICTWFEACKAQGAFFWLGNLSLNFSVPQRLLDYLVKSAKNFPRTGCECSHRNKEHVASLFICFFL